MSAQEAAASSVLVKCIILQCWSPAAPPWCPAWGAGHSAARPGECPRRLGRRGRWYRLSCHAAWQEDVRQQFVRRVNGERLQLKPVAGFCSLAHATCAGRPSSVRSWVHGSGAARTGACAAHAPRRGAGLGPRCRCCNQLLHGLIGRVTQHEQPWHEAVALREDLEHEALRARRGGAVC